MTRLWPGGDPVQVTVDPGGVPRTFLWQGEQHRVAHVGARWRVQASWWSPVAAVSREYVRLTTAGGLLCLLYRDLQSGDWFCARLYD